MWEMMKSSDPPEIQIMYDTRIAEYMQNIETDKRSFFNLTHI